MNELDIFSVRTCSENCFEACIASPSVGKGQGEIELDHHGAHRTRQFGAAIGRGAVDISDWHVAGNRAQAEPKPLALVAPDRATTDVAAPRQAASSPASTHIRRPPPGRGESSARKRVV